ncbi:hypothetical protein [Paractinoplanes maris]|uniref:hypothetical protein n=1 Tax=Paractinoplanes maris TaxID=1734446 RepID=UPI0020207102|nr:hypothetical protein [Actinoplanes maris]
MSTVTASMSLPAPAHRPRHQSNSYAWSVLERLEQRCDSHTDAEDARHTLSCVRRNLEAARSLLGQRRSVSDRWNGNSLDEIYSRLHRAEADLVEVARPDQLAGTAAHVLSRVAHYLAVDDPTRKKVEDGDHDRFVLAEGLRAAHAVKDREHRRLRTLRNKLIIILPVLTAAVAFIAIAGAIFPEAISLCFGKAGEARICPTAAAGPASGDVFLVLMLGMLGAALTAAGFLHATPSTGTPFIHVSLLLTALKLPLGALTAVVGLLLVHGGFVPGLTALDTPGQICAWALFFGAAQHAVSRLLDTHAHRLEDRAVRQPR